MVNAALYAMTESASLVVAADKKKHLLGIANGTDTDGKCGLGNLVRIVVEETGVCDKGILGKSANAGSGGERGEGLVEGDVSVNAAAAKEEVDSAVGCDLVLVSLALGLKILCIPLRIFTFSAGMSM